MRIRDFTIDDVPTMIELGRKMQAESNYDGLSFDPDVLMEMGYEWEADRASRFAKIAEDENGKIYAMYVGFISRYYFGQDLVANDLLLFCDPDRRGGLAAAKLIKAFEEWAFANGAKEVRPASSTGVQIERTKQLYEALGYETIGHVFRKRS